MSGTIYQKFLHRHFVSVDGLHLTHIVEKESDLKIYTGTRLDRESVESGMRLYLWEIENYIAKDRGFFIAEKPVRAAADAPRIIRLMAMHSAAAGAGPMSAAAGVIADLIGGDLIDKGYKDVIVQNGINLFIRSARTRRVRLYAGRAHLWNDVTLKISPRRTPCGIALVSGALAHVGIAESAAVIAQSAGLADVVSRVIAGRVHVKDDVARALDFARKIRGVRGVVIICRQDLASCGEVDLDR